jgi:hypothetical protein
MCNGAGRQKILPCRAVNRTVFTCDVMTVTAERESLLRIVALTQFFDNLHGNAHPEDLLALPSHV